MSYYKHISNETEIVITDNYFLFLEIRIYKKREQFFGKKIEKSWKMFIFQ